MKRTNRMPGAIWSTRRDMKGGYVRTAEDDQIVIAAPPNAIWVSRSEARLLAKRINECLDATVIR